MHLRIPEAYLAIKADCWLMEFVESKINVVLLRVSDCRRVKHSSYFFIDFFFFSPTVNIFHPEGFENRSIL